MRILKPCYEHLRPWICHWSYCAYHFCWCIKTGPIHWTINATCQQADDDYNYHTFLPLPHSEAAQVELDSKMSSTVKSPTGSIAEPRPQKHFPWYISRPQNASGGNGFGSWNAALELNFVNVASLTLQLPGIPYVTVLSLPLTPIDLKLLKTHLFHIAFWY